MAVFAPLRHYLASDARSTTFEFLGPADHTATLSVCEISLKHAHSVFLNDPTKGSPFEACVVSVGLRYN